MEWTELYFKIEIIGKIVFLVLIILVFIIGVILGGKD